MYLFSPQMRAQLELNRTVNVHGRRGKNIFPDLFMEYLNRECKGILSEMYSMYQKIMSLGFHML